MGTMTATPEYHLTITGSAPSGESFDVSLYFDRPVLMRERIEAIGRAAYEATRAVVLDPEGASTAERPREVCLPTDSVEAIARHVARESARDDRIGG